MSREDQLTNRLVKHYENSEYDNDVYLEHHYNHYGDRGVVDLVAKEKSTGNMHLFEIKSAAAIESATGANEIIRQFNRMRRYYFRDESTPNPRSRVNFELCFTPDYECYRHIEENADLYKSMVRSDVDAGLNSTAIERGPHPMVTMRPVDEDKITPVMMFSANIDYRETIDEFGAAGGTMLGKWVTDQYSREA